MTIYTLTVGSTDTFDAWAYQSAILTALGDRSSDPVFTTGVWAGEPERVARYLLLVPSDDIALRLATGVAMITGNDCILVTRNRMRRDDGSMVSNRRFLCRTDIVSTGNRTLFQPDATGIGTGYRYVPDITGDTIAYLAWRNGTVTTV